MTASRDVNKFIAAEIWPKLRELGFESIKGRVARRTHADRVDILEFTTFSSYNSQLFKLKPGSFSIVMGCHLEYVWNTNNRADNRVVRVAVPGIPQCLLRAQLRRRYVKPVGLHREYWPVGVKGVPFEKVMSGARDAVLGEGMRWFDQFRTPASVYELLEKREEDMSRLWGCGGPGSPMRHYMSGYAALAMRKPRIARKHFMHVLGSGCFAGHARRMRADAGLP